MSYRTAAQVLRIVVFLAVLVCAQAVTGAIVHSHHQSPEHRCQLCSTASGLVAPLASPAIRAPLLAAKCAALEQAAGEPLDPHLIHESSRAPPA